ncbi:MAG TPA: hypothetical protein PKW79_02575 [Rhabdochlamydiaceae bacterium]|nr:hypothetical protein [Rhabdochlamydiaceae bacterium]
MISVKEALSWGYHQIGRRVVITGHAALYTYNTAITAAQGVFNSAAFLASFGTNPFACDISRHNAICINYGLPRVYLGILGIINPNVLNAEQGTYGLPPDIVQGQERTVERTPLEPTRIEISHTSVALRSLAIRQHNLMRRLNESNLFDRHVTARLAAPVTAVAAIVYAAVRMVFGAIAAIGSALLCGLNVQLNQFAWHNLANGGFILNQLQNGLLGIIRPDLV